MNSRFFSEPKVRTVFPGFYHSVKSCPYLNPISLLKILVSFHHRLGLASCHQISRLELYMHILTRTYVQDVPVPPVLVFM